MNKCVIKNYIPHKTPINVNYNKWINCYYEDLINLYIIFSEDIVRKYPDTTIDFKNNNLLFNKFCIFIFKCSSKYII
jgi:hypothetical protein